MHDQREKAQRDDDWMLSAVRRQGLQEGIEQGREEGTIYGAIQAMQQILGDLVSNSHEFSGRSDVELKTQLAELQVRVRSRLN